MSVLRKAYIRCLRGNGKKLVTEVVRRIWLGIPIDDIIPKQLMPYFMEGVKRYMDDFKQYHAYEQMWKSLRADIERFAEAYGKMGMCAVYPEKGNYQTFKNILRMMDMYEEERIGGKE